MVRRTVFIFLILYTVYFVANRYSLLSYNILAWIELLQNGTPYSMPINLWAEYISGLITPVIFGLIIGNILKPLFLRKQPSKD